MERFLIKIKSKLLPKQRNNTGSTKLDEYIHHTRQAFENSLKRNSHHESIWIEYALFEEIRGYTDKARHVFERAVELFRGENMSDKLFIEFARFEGRQKDYDRARMIFKFASEELPNDKTIKLLKARAIYEINCGNRSDSNNTIIPHQKRKNQLKQDIADNPRNYDAWLDYLLLVEQKQVTATIRRVYEQAVANVPPTTEKDAWRTYITIWIAYAHFEEIKAEDVERTRQVYKSCLDITPHRIFSFSKIWLLYARFEVRCNNLETARGALSQAMSIRPRNKLFRGFIEMETDSGEFERCRILYRKFLEFRPECCTTWTRYAEMEMSLGDIDRARGVFKLAVTRSHLDMPELLLDAYIDFERKHGTADSVKDAADSMPKRTRYD